MWGVSFVYKKICQCTENQQIQNRIQERHLTLGPWDYKFTYWGKHWPPPSWYGQELGHTAGWHGRSLSSAPCCQLFVCTRETPAPLLAYYGADVQVLYFQLYDVVSYIEELDTSTLTRQKKICNCPWILDGGKVGVQGVCDFWINIWLNCPKVFIIARMSSVQNFNIVSPTNHLQPIRFSSCTDVCCVELFPHIPHIYGWLQYLFPKAKLIKFIWK